MTRLNRDQIIYMDTARARLLKDIGAIDNIGNLLIINGAHHAGFNAGIEYQDAELARLRAALERIAAGNPTKPGEWLTDIQMAEIARKVLKGE